MDPGPGQDRALRLHRHPLHQLTAASTPVARARSLVGAHVSVAGGLVRGTLARADTIGAEVVQVFVANPRGWAEPAPDPDGDEAFRSACAERSLPVFVHAPYLINFGSPSPETLRALARRARVLAAPRARRSAPRARRRPRRLGRARRIAGRTRWTRSATSILPLLDAGGPAAADRADRRRRRRAGLRHRLDRRLPRRARRRPGRAVHRHLPPARGRARPVDARPRMRSAFTRLAPDASAPAGSGCCTSTTAATRLARAATATSRSGRARIGLDAFAALFAHRRRCAACPSSSRPQDSGQAADIAALTRLRDRSS